MASPRIITPWLPPPQRTYIFLNATIVSPVSGTTIPHQTVKISKGVIESITTTENEYTLVTHPHETTIDLKGKYLCPGLIDNHVHISAVPGEKNLGDLFRLSHDVGLLRQPYMCRQMLARGFTSVRDCGGATLALKQAIADGLVEGPRLFIAGKALSQTGGHGDVRGPYDNSSCGCNSTDLSRVCDGVADCTRAAREELHGGADFIKIMSGGGVASPTDKMDSVQFLSSEIQAISEVARNAGTYVTAHAYTPRSIIHAISNGVTGIEHGNLIDAETARYMAKNNIFLTPTLVTYNAISHPDFKGYIPPGSMDKNQGILESGLKALRLASDAGVTICFGTDLLGPMTILQTQEFSIRSEVLSPVKILRSATVNIAKRLGMENFLGAIEEGFAADLLILNENPLDDITVLDMPEKHLLAVIKDGRVFNSRWSKLPKDTEKVTKLLE
ncbi:hypothetical protein HYALB_00008668 [Hymenoscyphus albidus]|uniref:Amidohydrolase-related domain-containing protein n=1 Tax=Hymenoscyphus albidus TaxID=595503 RepID=A0A9N9LI15_9HELO|nr:hypothetical protein HYALB_00008668 [Hymenoscyphus albidus]